MRIMGETSIVPKAHYLREIEKHFPNLRYKEARIIRHGWDHDVVVLDDKWVFRFTKNKDYLRVLRKEISVINWLKKYTKLPLPDYKYVAKDGSFGYYPMLKGRELRKHIFQRHFKGSKKERLAKELGEFLTVLHSLPLETAQHWGIKTGPYSRGAYEQRQVRMRKTLFPKLNAKEITWIEAQYKQFMELDWNFQPVVLHSDFTHHHILVDVEKGRVSGLIDFADVEVGDPARDLGALWEYGPAFVEETLKHYKGTVDVDLLDRSKFPNKYYMVNEMLEVLVNPRVHPSMSFEKSHEELRRAMKKHP